MSKINYVLVTVIYILSACSTKKDTSETDKTGSAVMTGADQDSHGCKGSAGYQWSAVRDSCVRLFETGIKLEPTSADKSTVAYLLFKSMDEDAQAEVFLPSDRAGRLLTKRPGEGAGTWQRDTLTLEQWKGMYTLTGKSGTVLYQGAAVPELGEEAKSPKLIADVKTTLQGKWQSTDEAGETFTINGASITYFSGGQKKLTRSFAYIADCKHVGCTDKSSYGCFTTTGKFDVDCQAIVTISDTELTITQGSNTGKTLRYKKIPA